LWCAYDDLIWRQVSELLHDPQRLEREHNRRLKRNKKDEPQRLENERKNLQSKIARMMDSYADGLLSKEEFEPRIKHTKAQLAKVEEQCKRIKDEESNSRQLQLLIVRLDEFAAKVKSKLHQLDWDTRRQIIRSLVKRVEIDQEQINVIFRVGALHFELAPVAGGESLQHCNRHYGGSSIRSCAKRRDGFSHSPRSCRLSRATAVWQHPNLPNSINSRLH
jgi:site-specific DNA recombinase